MQSETCFVELAYCRFATVICGRTAPALGTAARTAAVAVALRGCSARPVKTRLVDGGPRRRRRRRLGRDVAPARRLTSPARAPRTWYQRTSTANSVRPGRSRAISSNLLPSLRCSRTRMSSSAVVQRARAWPLAWPARSLRTLVQRFLTADSVRPGRSRAISSNLLPTLRCSRMTMSSSVGVQGFPCIASSRQKRASESQSSITS